MIRTRCFNDISRPIDVEAYLDQFKDRSPAGHTNPTFVASTPRRSTKRQAPSKSAYIPTEDEIDTLERLGRVP